MDRAASPDCSPERTRPQTLAYALNDSPTGLAAWFLEKLRAWSDCGGDVFSGGHFAAWEEPGLLVEDLTAFFGSPDVRA